MGSAPSYATIRGQWGLSLLDVEERSLRLAQEWGSPSYQISASWLGRVEREDHELSATKVLVLSAIYNIPSGEMLGYCQPENGGLPRFNPLAGPNTTLLLAEGPLGRPGTGPVAGQLQLRSCPGRDDPSSLSRWAGDESVSTGHHWTSRSDARSDDSRRFHGAD